LIDALQDPESRTRAQIASALGQIGSNASNAVPALTGALADEWWYVRENAAIALGKLGPNASSAIPALAKLAKETETRTCGRRQSKRSSQSAAILSNRLPDEPRKSS